MNCPICGKPYESMKRNKFGGAEYHHAGDPLNVFCQQSSASYKAAEQSVHLTGGESAPLEASSTPQPDSGLKAGTTPPTSK